MKNAKKIIALILAFVVAIGATVAITVALLTDEESAVNVMTVGNVYIDQYEQERVDDSANQTTLKEFTQGQMLLPAWYTTDGLELAPAEEWPVANDAAWSVVSDNENVMDKFVTVKNTGTTEAYVRTVFAVEVGTCRDKIHLVVNDTTDWAWEVTAQGVSIDGSDSVYDILVATYIKPLAPGATTIPSLKQVYLDVSATNDDVKSFGTNYEILVVSQAVQAAGFGTLAYSVNTTDVTAPAVIESALDTAFYNVTATVHPWDEGVVLDSYVLNAEQLQAALNNGGKVVLNADVALTVGETFEIPEGVEVELDLNGKTVTGNIAKADGHVLENYGTLSLSDGSVTSNAANGGSAIYNAGTMTVENTVITGAPQEGESWPSYAINNYGDLTLTDSTVTSTHGAVSTGKNTNLTVNGCDVTCNGFGGSSHVFYVSGNITVNGGTYTHNGNVDGSLAYIMSGASMTVNDGNFSASNGAYGLATTGGNLIVNGGTFANGFLNWGGPIEITGGTFASDPAKYVNAAYCEVIKNEDKTYTVRMNDGVTYASGAEQLQAAMEQGGTVVMAASVEVDAPIEIPEGVAVTLDLNGKTLTAADQTEQYAFNNLGDLTLTGNGTVTARGIYNGYDADGNHVTTANLTIKGGTYNAMGTNGGAAVFNYGSVTIDGGSFESNGGYGLNNRGTMTVNAGNIRGGIYNMGALTVNSAELYQHLSGKHAVYTAGTDASVVINDGAFDSISGNELINAAGGKVVLNGGTYDKTGKSYLFAADAAAEFTINAGTYNGYVNQSDNSVDPMRSNKTICVKGGTFNFDPSYWLVDGFKVESADGTWTVKPAVSDAAGLADAITNAADGAVIGIAAGEYTLPSSVGGKTLTITGSADAVIDLSKANGVNGANITFNGVTVKTTSTNYTGIQHSGDIVYNNVTFEGSTFLYGDSVTFNSCTFNLSTNYLWTYGAAEVNFNGCTFNTDGKAILIYKEQGAFDQKVNIVDCTFNATKTGYTGAGDACAAVEIDSSLITGTFTVNFSGTNTVDSDFAGLYRIKAHKDPMNVVINEAQ